MMLVIILLFTILITIFLFIALRRQVNAGAGKRLYGDLIMNYPYFCLGDMLSIMTFILCISCLGWFGEVIWDDISKNWTKINQINPGSWAAIILFGIVILLIIFGSYLLCLSSFLDAFCEDNKKS